MTEKDYTLYGNKILNLKIQEIGLLIYLWENKFADKTVDCLGFLPRSESFAFELAVQVGSISSLSGINAVRKFARCTTTCSLININSKFDKLPRSETNQCDYCLIQREVGSEPVCSHLGETRNELVHPNYDFLKFATFKKYFLHYHFNSVLITFQVPEHLLNIF